MNNRLKDLLQLCKGSIVIDIIGDSGYRIKCTKHIGRPRYEVVHYDIDKAIEEMITIINYL